MKHWLGLRVGATKKPTFARLLSYSQSCSKCLLFRSSSILVASLQWRFSLHQLFDQILHSFLVWTHYSNFHLSYVQMSFWNLFFCFVYNSSKKSLCIMVRKSDQILNTELKFLHLTQCRCLVSVTSSISLSSRFKPLVWLTRKPFHQILEVPLLRTLLPHLQFLWTWNVSGF